MTTAKYPVPVGHIIFPDPPEQKPEDMTSFDHTNATGNTHHLIKHFGNPETTIVAGEHYISPEPTSEMTGLRYPDLYIAFNADPAAYKSSNAYVVSEQGKPPDFVLEIASRSTGRQDVEDKPADYAALGIAEYWRLDETGAFHRTRLAGDRLVDGRYVPIPMGTLHDGSIQGFSAVLNLILRWERGQLAWIDPATGQHITTYDDLAARASNVEVRAERERSRADQEGARAEEQRSRAELAEARVRKLEEQIRGTREH